MSALSWWLASIAYSVVGLAIGCRCAALLAWRMARIDREKYAALYRGNRTYEPDGEQWFGAALFGLAAAVVWPAVALLFVSRGSLLAPPRDVQAEQQRKRIEALERELEMVR